MRLLSAGTIGRTKDFTGEASTSSDQTCRATPEADYKVFLLGHLNGNGLMEIADPYNGTMDDFQNCFQTIRQSCDNLVRRMEIAE